MDISNSFDTQILETLYLTKYKLFFRYALIQTKSERDAEELVHDSFCTALEKLESFNSSNNPEGWIMKTLKNKVSNFRRKYFSKSTFSLEEPWVKEAIYIHDFEIDKSIGLLEYCKDHLSDMENSIIRYILFEEHSFTEASEVFHISIWSCQKKYQRILKKLRIKAKILCEQI